MNIVSKVNTCCVYTKSPDDALLALTTAYFVNEFGEQNI
jgi:hypothetical protein